MALRKISDLPGLSPQNREFTQENFGKSLLEVTYCLSADEAGDRTYVSRYMTAGDFLSSAYRIVPAGEVQLCSVYEKIADLSSQISSIQAVLSGMQAETWTFCLSGSSEAVQKSVYVKSVG